MQNVFIGDNSIQKKSDDVIDNLLMSFFSVEQNHGVYIIGSEPSLSAALWNNNDYFSETMK